MTTPGPWIQDPDAANGRIWFRQNRTFADADTLVASSSTWSDTFSAGTIGAFTMEDRVLDATPIFGYDPTLDNARAEAQALSPSYLSLWRPLFAYARPDLGILPQGAAGGDASTPPTGAVDWEFDPDDVDTLAGAIVMNIGIAGYSTYGGSIGAYVVPSSYYTTSGSDGTWAVTSVNFPGRSGLTDGAAVVSATGAPTTDPTPNAFGAGALTLSLAECQPFAVMVSHVSAESGTSPGDGRLIVSAFLTARATYRPRRWRWIFANEVTPPLLARGRRALAMTPHARGAGPSTTPLLARSRGW